MEKKKVLILGTSGMLGHRVYKTFKDDERYEVIGCQRGEKSQEIFGLEYSDGIYTGFDILEMGDKSIATFIEFLKPDFIINCIGLTKPNINEENPIPAIKVNSLFPHQLVCVCNNIGARLIHISTDCVFSGIRGHYTSDDISDAEDLYGRTKYLGEVRQNNHLTIRTSIIGHELGRRKMFVEWLCGHLKEKSVKGYTNHMWTGVTTDFLAKTLLELVENKEVGSLIQLAGEKASKYDLVKMIDEEYNLQLNIEPHETQHDCDRSLINTSGIEVPPLKEMIKDMRRDYIEKK